MADRYPEIEPYEHGMLDAGDGQLVYWEVCGNLDGNPAVGLNGRCPGPDGLRPDRDPLLPPSRLA
jgi:proline iminopeptidase